MKSFSLVIVLLTLTVCSSTRQDKSVELLEKIHDLDKRVAVVEFWLKGPT